VTVTIRTWQEVFSVKPSTKPADNCPRCAGMGMASEPGEGSVRCDDCKGSGRKAE
jgi:DnaJ-class molecular chaperone